MNILYEPYYKAVKDGARVLHQRDHGGDGENFCHICFQTTSEIIRAIGVPELLTEIDYAKRGWSPGQVQRALRFPYRVHNPYIEEE